MSEPTWDGQWSSPPPRKRGNEVWASRLAPVRERPGEWAKFGPFSYLGTSHQVAKIKRGVYGSGFDAYRTAIAGKDWIFVCFAGPALEIVAEEVA